MEERRWGMEKGWKWPAQEEGDSGALGATISDKIWSSGLMVG